MVSPLVRWIPAVIATVGLLMTAPAARADFSFVHVTDTHVTASEADGSTAKNDAARFKEIAALSPAPAFVINTGDVCEAGTPAEYAVYRKIRDENLGTLKTYVAPGNHDVRWNPTGKEGYTQGTGQPLYQSWDKDNIHFILLDSTVLLQHWGHLDQGEMAWLRKDLEKTGNRRPIIIGFHHWVGREGGKVDNESEFITAISQYNVRLLLMGHGHSDLLWNVNGTPAIMAKGLYQGSYHVIKVSRNKLEVFRRTEASKSPDELVLSEPLARPFAPGRVGQVSVESGQATVTLSHEVKDGLPENSVVTYHVDDTNKEIPLEKTNAGWSGTYSLGGVAPGTHTIIISATTPDKQTYLTPVTVTLAGANSPLPLWRTKVGGAVQGKITRSGDTLFVPTMEGDLVALTTQNGREKWRFHTNGAVFSAPLVQNNVVYFGSADHFVYAVSADTGTLVWKTETGGAVFAGAGFAQNTVCIGSTDTKIYGLNAQTGKQVWTVQGGNMFQSQTATDGTHFFVGGWDNTFRCINASDGAEVWKNTYGKSFYYSPAIGSPAVSASGDAVLVSSNDGVLHAINALDGTAKWEVPGPALGYSGPLLSGDRVYQASLTPTGRVFAFNAATGKTIWDSPVGAEIYDSSCALGNDKTPTIYIGSVSALVSALAAGSGRLLWQYHLPPGHVLSSPVTDETAVYIGSMNGQVTALPLARPSAQ